MPDPFLYSRTKKQHKLHKSKSSYGAFSSHSLKWHLRLNNSCLLKVDHLSLGISCFRMHAFDLSHNKRRDIGLKWSACLIHLFSSFKFIFESDFLNYCFILCIILLLSVHVSNLSVDNNIIFCSN